MSGAGIECRIKKASAIFLRLFHSCLGLSDIVQQSCLFCCITRKFKGMIVAAALWPC